MCDEFGVLNEGDDEDNDSDDCFRLLKDSWVFFSNFCLVTQSVHPNAVDYVVYHDE